MWKHQARPASKDYPKFNALVYSLETFLPLVKLGMADRWEPNGHREAYFIEKSWLMTGGLSPGIPLAPHDRRVGAFGLVDRRHNWASEDVSTSNLCSG
jgi:hypothetical protein